MRIIIKAKPGAKEQGIEKIANNSYVVSVKEPPIQGKANKAIIAALAQYFNKSISEVSIVLGHTLRKKIVEIQD